MANQRGSKSSGAQGTGKHPHKSTEEPQTREEGAEHSASAESRGRGSESHSGGSDHGSADHKGSQSHEGSKGTDDLKQREYRDAQGNVHHHTRTSGAMQEEGEGGEEE